MIVLHTHSLRWISMGFKIFQEDAEGFRLYQGSFDGLTWSFNELQDISRGFREASGGCRAFFLGFQGAL